MHLQELLKVDALYEKMGSTAAARTTLAACGFGSFRVYIGFRV